MLCCQFQRLHDLIYHNNNSVKCAGSKKDGEGVLGSVRRIQVVTHLNGLKLRAKCNSKEMKLQYSSSFNAIHPHGLRFCSDGEYSSSPSAMERSCRKLNLMMPYRVCRVRGFGLSSDTNGKNSNGSEATYDAYKHSGGLPRNSDIDYENRDSSERDFAEVGHRIEVEIEKTGNNRRRIQSRISVKANLQRVWNILTDYERLAEFIPGLAVSQVLEKRDNVVRLFQIGQQNLAFGLKFEAKGVIECCEGDLENLPSYQRRDIEFKMIKGDFQLFEGTWSIVESKTGGGEWEESELSLDEEWSTSSVSYVVEVEPKLWLPVGLVEGRLCGEIKMNLLSIKRAAERQT